MLNNPNPTNLKAADVLKAADGDIIFGNHNKNNTNQCAMIRSNLTEYSQKTLTNSHSEMISSITEGVGGHNHLKMIKSRSHSSQQNEDMNSTFIAGSLASAFVSSRKLSLSVDSVANEVVGNSGGGFMKKQQFKYEESNLESTRY